MFFLRAVVEIRRTKESPIPYKVDVLRRNQTQGPVRDFRAVMVAVEMKDGKIIGRFNEDVNQLVANMKPRLPEGLEIQKFSDQPPPVPHRIHPFIPSFFKP